MAEEKKQDKVSKETSDEMADVPDYKLHPLAEMLPVMSDEEFSNLCASILVEGLQEPIVLYGGQILDGRHRYEACRRVGVALKAVEFTGSEAEALGFVVSRNLQGRKLSASQRAVVAVRYLGRLDDGVAAERIRRIQETADGDEQLAGLLPLGKDGKASRSDVAGAMVGISGRYVRAAQALQELAPEKLDEVLVGNTTITKALREVKPGKPKKRRKSSFRDDLAKLVERAEKECPKLVGPLKRALECLKAK